MKRVEITKDNVAKVFGSLQQLVGQRVLIGIPESTNHRDEDAINNAQIGYIHEFGSPASNIPARPFLIPGVKKAEKPALEQLKKAATAALDGESKKADQALNAAGIIGMNAARTEIGSNIPPPLSPDTVRNRKYQRGTKSRRANEQQYLDLIANGTPPADAQAQAGIVSLIDTGALRNSLTYVVKKK